jgi:hypothetical protein
MPRYVACTECNGVAHRDCLHDLEATMTDPIREEIERYDRERRLKEIRNRPILEAMPKFWDELKRIVQSKVNSLGGGLEYEEQDIFTFEIHGTGFPRERLIVRVVKNERFYLDVHRSTITQSQENIWKIDEIEAESVNLFRSKEGEEFRTSNDVAKYLLAPLSRPVS